VNQVLAKQSWHQKTRSLRMRQPKVWTSLFIILVIGLHALPVISYQGNRQTRWPFLSWSMFAQPVPPGPIQMTRRFIYGFTAGARRELITASLVGINQSTYGRGFVRPMAQGDTAVAQRLFRRLNDRRDDPFVELRVETEVSTLVGDSVVKQSLPPVSYRAGLLESRPEGPPR
jgi:hypothetical protein